MPKKPRKTRKVFEFTIAEVFPPDDPVAMHLLCLMAAQNDMSFVVEAMMAHLHVPLEPPAQSVAANRLFCLQRLLAAMTSEALTVLAAAEALPGFQAVHRHLSEEGKIALDTLHTVPVDRTNAVYRVLHTTRNKAAFHFDPGQFSATLGKMLDRYGMDAKSDIIHERGTDYRGRIYYGLAAQVAAEIAFGLPAENAPPLVQEAFLTSLEMLKALSAFIEAAQAAYLTSRGKRRVFRRATPR